MFLNYKRSFKFDHVFGPNSTQFSVFETLVKPSLEVLLRRSATDSGSKAAAIVTYGQTGSGKTYTLGTDFSFEKMVRIFNLYSILIAFGFVSALSGHAIQLWHNPKGHPIRL